MTKPYIICVDDEKIILDSLKLELKGTFGNDYNIEVAESGEEAIEIIDEILKKNEELYLVISDYIMPEMKGDELLETVHFKCPEAFCIMLTGQATIEGVTNAINKAKLYRYLSKPWEQQDFILTINEALKSYARLKQIEEQNEEIRKQNTEIKEINTNLDKLVKIRTHELEEKIEELVEVKISKFAFTILFIVALVMFLLVDAIIEPLLQNMLHNFFVILVIKAIIAFLIKPVESFFERYLITQARKKNIKIKEN
ncbi:MAG: response regulator [Candidatus Kapabacteria bacterium]|nr:response regulator [Candidatus Kapabacteria bacterium]